MDKTVAIVIVGTGKYSSFADDLQKSIREKFLPRVEKKIFLFSDSENFHLSEEVALKRCRHDKWPLSSLNRFEHVLSIKDELLLFDYVLYLDSDLLVVDDVKDFPFSKLFAVLHPQNLISSIWDVETNPISTAFLGPQKLNDFYVQGCLWGGESAEVIKMCQNLYKNAQDDLKKGIIAIWFDESHLNKYFVENREIISYVSPSYAYPESWNLGHLEKKIIHREKRHEEIRD
jgi:hypothetical protein